MSLPNFKIRDLLILTGVLAAAAALIADEPISVGLAAVLCVVFYNGIAALTLFSAVNLWRQTSLSIANRSLRPLVSRIKWLVIDTVIVVLLVASISITNYVLASHVKLAPWLLLIGAAISPLTACRLVLAGPGRHHRVNNNKPAADDNSMMAKVSD